MNKKIVVISGGSSGLGRELVKLFDSSFYKNQSFTVVSLSRTNKEGFEGHIPCDISSIESIEAAGQQIKERYGRVDILINNAGLGISGATEMLPDKDIEDVINVDYLGALRLSRVCLPLMDKKAKIVNISSVCALFALPYRGVYCSAKAAVNMLSYTMRQELARFGIKVISICPGEIKTDFTANRLKHVKTNEKYGDSPYLSAQAIDEKNDERMPAKKVAKKVFRIAVNKKGALYIIGTKHKFFNFAQRVLPVGMFNGVVNKMFNKR